MAWKAWEDCACDAACTVILRLRPQGPMAMAASSVALLSRLTPRCAPRGFVWEDAVVSVYAELCLAFVEHP